MRRIGIVAIDKFFYPHLIDIFIQRRGKYFFEKPRKIGRIIAEFRDDDRERKLGIHALTNGAWKEITLTSEEFKKFGRMTFCFAMLAPKDVGYDFRDELKISPFYGLN